MSSFPEGASEELWGFLLETSLDTKGPENLCRHRFCRCCFPIAVAGARWFCRAYGQARLPAVAASGQLDQGSDFCSLPGPTPQSSQLKAFLEQVIGSTDQAGAGFHIASATVY